MLDYYQLLRVGRLAAQDEIRRGYHALIRNAHPDADGNNDYAAMINDAYAVLSDPGRRRDYDRSLEPKTIVVQVPQSVAVREQSTYSKALANELADELVRHALAIEERLAEERSKRLG